MLLPSKLVNEPKSRIVLKSQFLDNYAEYWECPALEQASTALIFSCCSKLDLDRVLLIKLLTN